MTILQKDHLSPQRQQFCCRRVDDLLQGNRRQALRFSPVAQFFQVVARLVGGLAAGRPSIVPSDTAGRGPGDRHEDLPEASIRKFMGVAKPNWGKLVGHRRGRMPWKPADQCVPVKTLATWVSDV